MFGWSEAIQILAGCIGTLGFALLYNIRGRRLIYAAIGGLLSWLFFLLFGLIVQNDVLQSFLSAVLVTAYAEVLARALRTPATTFSIVSLIPLVPGSSLYYSMTAALSETYVDFLDRATYTLKIAAALSMGLILVTAVSKHVRLWAQHRTERAGTR